MRSGIEHARAGHNRQAANFDIRQAAASRHPGGGGRGQAENTEIRPSIEIAAVIIAHDGCDRKISQRTRTTVEIRPRRIGSAPGCRSLQTHVLAATAC